MQGFMPPDAFMFETSGQLVMQTAIGGAGTLFGPLVGATVWLYLSDFLQTTLHLGASWKLVLGIVFVLLVCFLRHGLIGGIKDLYSFATRTDLQKPEADEEPVSGLTAEEEQKAAQAALVGEPIVAPMPVRDHMAGSFSGPILQASGLTKRYGGLVANSEIDFTVYHGELRGVIGPNGAGKTTFFKMLTCEIPPTSGTIIFEGRDITGMNVTDVCQLGLTKSYQVNQLFTRLTVRENLTMLHWPNCGASSASTCCAAVGNCRLKEQVEQTLDLVNLVECHRHTCSQLAYGEKRRLEIGLALATSPSLLLLDEPLAGMSPRERVETVKLLK